MSSQPFSDVRGNTAPPVYRCDTCGLPLREGNHSQCQNPVALLDRKSTRLNSSH